MTAPGGELKGRAEWDKALDGWLDRAAAATETGVKAAGEILVTEARAGIHSISGKLAASIQVFTPTRKGFGDYEAKVGPAGSVPYARKVELGKRGHHSAPAHPYFTPGYKRAGKQFAAAFIKAWGDAAPKKG